MRGSTHKRCTQCLHTKPLEEFKFDYRASDERTSACRSCYSVASKKKSEKESQEVAEHRLMSYIDDTLCGDMSHEDFMAKPKALWRA